MREPFIELYDNYYEDVYRYVRWKTPNRWDADDIVSEVFRKAFEHYRSLREGTNAKAWLLTIARNSVTDFYRRRRDFAQADGIEQESGEKPMVERIELDEEIECLRSALHRLPEDDREIITLRYFTELKFEGIGQILGRTGDSVKVRSHRLLKKLGTMVRLCLEGGKEYA